MGRIQHPIRALGLLFSIAEFILKLSHLLERSNEQINNIYVKLLHTPPHIYTPHKHTHTHIYVPLGNLRTGRKKTEERGCYWWLQVPRKTKTDLMETSRGCCLSSRREAKVLRKDLIHKCLEDRKDLRL